jgi:hypothetical protein
VQSGGEVSTGSTVYPKRPREFQYDFLDFQKLKIFPNIISGYSSSQPGEKGRMSVYGKGHPLAGQLIRTHRFSLLAERLLFCDKVMKINQKKVSQERVLLITDRALYNLK